VSCLLYTAPSWHNRNTGLPIVEVSQSMLPCNHVLLLESAACPWKCITCRCLATTAFDQYIYIEKLRSLNRTPNRIMLRWQNSRNIDIYCACDWCERDHHGVSDFMWQPPNTFSEVVPLLACIREWPETNSGRGLNYSEVYCGFLHLFQVVVGLLH
jgi:hypothetical protein